MGKSWKKAGMMAKSQAKGAQFTKLAREIQVAAKLGGPDPESNSRLRMAVDAAKAVSCPKDTIERAIKKGSGQLDGGIIEEAIYEGYAPHQVAIIVECQTDNKNRTATDIRTIFNKCGGSLGEMGSVAWMFDRVSLVSGKPPENMKDPEEEAIEAGANEVEEGSNEGDFDFYGAMEDLDKIRTALTERGWQITAAEPSYKAKTLAEVSEEGLKEVHEFLQKLEDTDDSHRVYANI